MLVYADATGVIPGFMRGGVKEIRINGPVPVISTVMIPMAARIG